jgi:hypothetical protein
VAKTDLTVRVNVEGADDAKRSLDNIADSAEKAGKSAEKAGKQTSTLGQSVGDLSEKLDKDLDQSVGRAFKGFDRINSIVGQVGGTLGLGALAVAGLSTAYDHLVKPMLESTKRMKEQEAQLARLQAAAEDAARAMSALASEVGANIEALSPEDIQRQTVFVKSIEQLESQLASAIGAQAVAARQAAAAERSVVRAEIAKDQAWTVAAMRGAKEAEATARDAAARAQAAQIQAEERIRRLRAQLGLTRGEFAAFQADIKRDFEQQGPEQAGAGPAADVARAAGGRRGPSAAEQLEEQLAREFDAYAEHIAGVERLRAEEQAFDRKRAEEREKLAQEAAERMREREAFDRDVRTRSIEDETAREMELLRQRQAEEMSAAATHGADMLALHRLHIQEREQLEEDAHRARIQRQREEVKTTAATTGMIAQTFGEAAREFGLGVGAEMVAAGVQDAADAASYAADAVAEYASYNYYSGTAYALAATLKTASAIKQFAGAARLGAGGGGGAGAPAIPVAPPPQQRDVSGGAEGGQSTTINVTFQGRAFVTRREVREDMASIMADRGRGGRAA